MRKNKKEGKFNVKLVILILVIIVIMILSGTFFAKKIMYPLNHFEIVKQESSKNNIDPYLVMAIIKTESGFEKYATSNKEAKGLMQIMDSTAEDIKKLTNDEVGEDIYDENVNIALGCKYFSSLVNKYNGNYYLAICAYNAGMGNVDKWIDQGVINDKLDSTDVSLPFSETTKYLQKVITSYEMYKKIYG